MALYLSDDDYSDTDSEVFVGPLTLPEIKKRFLSETHRHTVGSTAANDEDNYGESFKLIEIHSAPNILIQEESKLRQNVVAKLCLSPQVNSNWDIDPNDSFLQIEKMVSDLCVNTNEIIDQISKESNGDQKATQSISPCVTEIQNNDQSEAVQINENLKQNIESPYKQSDATNLLAPEANAANTDFLTPTKEKTTSEMYYTPSQEKNHASLFKTPGIPVSQKKIQTPSTKRSFQHVVSPVATYINKCPVVPLVKDVRPKKPLVATSSIPKPIKSVLKANLNNKENIKLPSFAYKAAKETKMIDIPDEGKLPQNQWAKQLVSSIPRATVIKHDHREGSLKKPLKHHQEDSFADLSMHQADVSVCTQKCAFNKPKKLL